MKIDRDSKLVKQIMVVAIDVFKDESVPLIDRVTRVRAAITLGKDAALDVRELQALIGE